MKNNGWIVVQDSLGKMGPYAYSSQLQIWVGYDDPTFSVVKSNYIIAKGLGGAMLWDISHDDFGNCCGGGVNPIQTTIGNTFGN